MAVKGWCKLCRAREEQCSLPDSHRAQNKIVWRASFRLGGRYGQQIRKVFKPGISKKDAETYEAIAVADYARGKFLPRAGSKSKMLYADFLDLYIETHVAVSMKGAKFEKYRFAQSRLMWGARPISAIQFEDAEKYILGRLKNGVLKSSVNREIAAHKVAFNWAVQHEYLIESPFSKIKKFKETRMKKRWLSNEEILLVLSTAEQLKDFDMVDTVIVAIDTGFRDANLRGLEARNLTGERVWAIGTKSGNDYSVPMTGRVKDTLSRLSKVRGHGKLLNFVNFRKRWHRLVEAAGLYRPERHPDNVTVHTLKHTFVTQCLERGIPVEVVSKWANHHSVDFTVKHYWHPSEKHESEQIKKLEA